MKEYKISIVGVKDFIIISPDVLGILIQRIKTFPDRQMEIPAEVIMPVEYANYLKRVINSNRDKVNFHFKQITEKELKTEDIYKILEYQMKNLKVEKQACFEEFNLITETSSISYNYRLEAKKVFFYICKDEQSRFTYVFPDGRQEKLILCC